jgi:hypothetical protein
VSVIRDIRTEIFRTVPANRDTRVRLVVLIYCHERATPNGRLRPNAATTVDYRVGQALKLLYSYMFQAAHPVSGVTTNFDFVSCVLYCAASKRQTELKTAHTPAAHCARISAKLANMNFTRLAFLAALAGGVEGFTFRADPSTLTYGQGSLVEMVGSYLDQLSGQSSFTAQPYTTSPVRAPEPSHSSYNPEPVQMDSGSAMGSYLDALGSNSNLNSNSGGMSLSSYLSNLVGPNTHLDKSKGSGAVYTYLDMIPKNMDRAGGAGFQGYTDTLGSQPKTFASAPAPAPAPRPQQRPASGISAYDQQMAAAMAASRAAVAPPAPAPSYFAPIASADYSTPEPVKAMNKLPVAASGGLRSFTDMLAVSASCMSGAGVPTYTSALPVIRRMAAGAGVLTHVDHLPANSQLTGGTGLLTYTDNLGSVAAASQFGASAYSAPAPAYSAPAPVAAAELGRGFAAAKQKGSGIGTYLDSL